MENKIKILFLKDIKTFLKNENPNYLIEKKEDIFLVFPFPITLKNTIRDIWNYIAYDFNQLSNENQKKYENLMYTFILLDQNQYILDTKIYQMKKKKNYLPKQKRENN